MVQQTMNPDETVLAEASDGAALVVYEHLPAIYEAEGVNEWLREHLGELDTKAGGLRFRYPDLEGAEATSDTEYEQFLNARLAFGLWARCGPFHQPESGRSVPKEVALAGKDELTAYLYLNNGYPLARSAVADMFDVTEQTISDRLSRVRWSP